MKGMMMTGISAAIGSGAGAQSSSIQQNSGGMIYSTLGRTGERVPAIGMGGFHIGQPKLSEDESIRLICSAIDRGITFMDNSWNYNQGQSEIRMGKALKDGYHQKVFLYSCVPSGTNSVFVY
jgi:predicted aldo/keto reductase-like oxidoreductase